jgi:hypothetical protein
MQLEVQFAELGKEDDIEIRFIEYVKQPDGS